MSLTDRISALTPEQRALFEALREKQRRAARVQPLQPPPIGQVSGPTGEGDWPLSLDQERFWFVEQLYPGRAGLSIVAATRMRGRLSIPLMAAGLAEIARRHAAWRTTFPAVGGTPVQRVAAGGGPRLALIDLTALPAARCEAEVALLVAVDAAAPFDLERGPLVRSSLLRLGAEEHVCLFTIHHLVTDFISFQIAWGELAVLYEALSAGRPAVLPEPPVQYPDFAVWQREWLRGEVLEDLVSWWRERLDGFPLALELPTDRPRPVVARMRGEQRRVGVPRELAEGLRALAREEGATLFMTVLAATAALLCRDSGQERMILGANNANRNRPEIAAALGCFLTQVPFPIDLTGDPSFRELLARVRQSALGAYAHQDLPFGKLVEAVQPERDTSRQPLVQALVQVLDGQISEARLAGITLEAVDSYDGNARYDLMLTLFDYPEGMAGSLEYDADLFEGATIERLFARLRALMAAAVADPGLRLAALPLLSAAERDQLQRDEHAPAFDFGPAAGLCVHDLIAERARLAPEAVAVVCGEERLSYRELDRRAEALARRLRASSVGPEVPVALCVERSAGLVVGMLGILKAGGVYVPLEPEDSTARLGFVLADSGAAALVTQAALGASLPAGSDIPRVLLEDLDDLDVPALPGRAPLPDNLAYVIYTSGSTGRPKGVAVTHAAMAGHALVCARVHGIEPGDRVLQFNSASFDPAVEQTCSALVAGATLVVRGPELWEPEELTARIADLELAVVDLPTAYWARWAAAEHRAGAPPRLRRVIAGGEEMRGGNARQWRHSPLAGVLLLNAYGPTEAVISATLHEVGSDETGGVPIGRPLPGRVARVLGRRGSRQPIGVPGELALSGPLARGYLGRPELTAERFVPDPFAGSGARLYRTGDLVRRRPDGELEFLGRVDDQVKVRGFRVEPGEIEAALRAHPEVAAAVVVARAEASGEKHLVAYCVPAGDAAACAASSLREHLAARLPAYMVPAAFVILPELPLGSTGKVDRSRLPAPERSAGEAGEAPRTAAEEIVAGIWCEVLGVPRVSRSANFFELGGHSLLATQVVSRLRAATGAELALREMFQAPTVAALAAAVAASLLAGGGVAAPPIRPVPRDADLPLSFAQERLWFLDRLAPGNAGYHIPLALAAHGDLSLPALEAALGAMVRRHEALRTTYVARGDRPFQRIAPPASWTLPLVDLAALPEAARRVEARRLADQEVARPFDLERDPVLRASALRLAPGEHELLMVVHHIAADGWSLGVMVEEIVSLYDPRTPGLPTLAVQYADFAVWQREWLQGETLERQLAYWRERLAGAPALDLPTDRPRPPAQSFRGATRMHAIGAPATQALAALARRHDATLFMLLLAAMQTLLGRYAGQDDVVLGSPIANRTRAEIEPLIGFFVNTLALRGDLAGDPPFGELVARARRAALEAYAHQDLPFERLVEELRPERRLSHNPIFQVMFALQNTPLRSIELPGLTFSPVEFAFPATRFDLEVFFTESEGGLAVQLTYATDLFDATTIARLESHLDTLLAAALAGPSRRLSELPLLTAPERHQLLLGWNDTAAAIPGEDLAALFAAQARLRPDAVAVASDAGDLTYAELDRRSARLARRLAAAGVGPEVRVALLAQRSPAMIVGLLGILKAGGAYVPLDPSYPADRLAWMLVDSQSNVLLGQPELLAELPEEAVGTTVMPLTADPDAFEGPEPLGPLPGGLAYMMYTSGSTGRPKGVGVTHRNIVRLVRESGFADLGADQVFLQLAPISFDASTLEIWAPLLNGGRIAVFPPRRPSLEELGETIARFGVTSLWLTAGLFHQMVDDRLEALRPLRQLLAGGDVLSPPHVRRALEGLPGLTLINGYGPTEGTTFTCCFPITAPEQGVEPVPIGRPIGNTRVYVLGPDLRPVPTGVWGELCAGGEGLSRGYLGNPDLTAERFVPDPFAAEPGGRLYRTGDVARFQPGGRIEFLGRRDSQVKLRGFRIELGEIESALARHPAVREAAVVARDGGPLGRRLIAYVVPRPATAANVGGGEGHQHVEHWRELYEQTYAKGVPPEGDAAFNLQGWNSSYTGEPISAGEMREWLDGTVGRLLALPHRRVLEVGCGTGLLLFRVAPEAERYRGTDFSDVALAQVHAELVRRGLPRVELAQGLADDWTGVRQGEFELVVLNSVVQYFPTVDYLVKVLAGAVAAVAPGGAVFVGDVRSLPLLEAFHASVQLHRAAGSLPAAELARRVGHGVADEEELVVDPELFLALARRLPAVRRVQVLLKRGRHANELTRFRYDVILHVGGEDTEAGGGEPGSRAWQSLSGLERLLEERPAALAVSGIPNSRLAGEVAVLELLAGREMETAGELRDEIERRVREAGEAIDPEDLWTLADRSGYDADLTWSSAGGADGRFDAILRRRGAGVPAGVTPWRGGIEDLPWTAYANDPLRADQARRLVPELRRALESELPEHMVPSAFVLLGELPLTDNGKVDRAALPAPERAAEPAEEWIAPATPLEELLARVVGDVLGVERVGMGDNFFDLGGHSLLATQLVSRLTQGHGVPVTLQMVFDAGNLNELADRIVEAELADADPGLLDEALSEMKDLSPEELQKMLEQVEGTA
ncbi:MAG TPA: amino acid adenylation domain-containing protein [Thermoanaerobaculia bacterium]|jgi:amino acid adenylation domain-containing protein|nr:amino acid adenylation domain-containing protein [Thermoanaerobaculia bacterium]